MHTRNIIHIYVYTYGLYTYTYLTIINLLKAMNLKKSQWNMQEGLEKVNKEKYDYNQKK